MNATQDAADAATDRNLRRLAQHVSLPAELEAPAARSAAAVPPRPPRRRPLLAIFGGGTAIAACLAVGAMLVSWPSQPRVEAATILQSLNEALSRAFKLSLEDLPDGQGGTMDGEITLAFDPLHAGENAESIYCEGWQRSDLTPDGSRPIDIRFAFAGLPDQAWLYLRTASIPQPLLEGSALAQVLVNWARPGVLIDLTGLRTENSKVSTRVATSATSNSDGQLKVISGGDVMRVLHDTLGMNKSRGNLRLEVGVQAGSEPQEGAKRSGHPPIFSFQLKSGGDDAASSAKPDSTRAAVSNVNQLAARLLHGRAGPGDIKHYFELLSESAKNVTVEEREPGVHVLVATDFHFDDDRLNVWLGPDTRYSVVYREGRGVESASVEHIGATNGSIRFETIDFTYDEASHGRRRFTGDGQTHVVDLAALLEAIRPFFNSESRP